MAFSYAPQQFRNIVRPFVRSLALLILLFALLVVPVGSQNSQSTQQLIETGTFHNEEVTAKSGEKWLGLHIADEGSVLLTYRLRVNAVFDLVVDEEGQKTGKEVTVDLPIQPLFLVKDRSLFSEGPVATIFDDGARPSNLAEITPITLNLDEASYVLKVGSEDTSKCPYQLLPRNARLVLIKDETKQVLYSLEDCGNDPRWELIWAGDIDRDGKLDLYISVTQHYNVALKKLFLSSQASEGQLVKEVAEFVTSGC